MYASSPPTHKAPLLSSTRRPSFGGRTETTEFDETPKVSCFKKDKQRTKSISFASPPIDIIERQMQRASLGKKQEASSVGSTSGSSVATSSYSSEENYDRHQSGLDTIQQFKYEGFDSRVGMA